MTNGYFPTLGRAADAAWQRFWFARRDARPLAVLRIIAGIAALYYLLTYTSDLVPLFGPRGLLDRASVARLVTSFGNETAFRFSLLQLWSDPSFLYSIHVLGLLIALAMTCGILTRWTTPLTLFIVLSYVHRAPMITGQLEPVLTMLLAYLSLGPAGAYYSLDAWRRVRNAKRKHHGKQPNEGAADARFVPPSIMANLSLRLIQVHLAAFYLLTGLTMLSGEIWWLGEGLLWLSENPESRIIDLGPFNTEKGIYVINIATHLVVAFMLVYGVLIWKRLARPLLAAVSLVVWLMLALVTGLASYAALMVALNAAFWMPGDGAEGSNA